MIAGAWTALPLSLPTDRDLAECELQRDPAYPLLSAAEVDICIERSLAIGKEQADRFVGVRPQALAVRLGVTVHITSSGGCAAGSMIRSEYDSRDRAITVYSRSLAEVEERLERLSAALGGPRLPCALAVHIAHELFHHLEAAELGRADDLLPTVTWYRLGPLALGRRRVARGREIAAHMFAKRLLDLPFLPNLLDLAMQDLAR